MKNKNNKKLRELNGKLHKLKFKKREKILAKSLRKKRKNGTPMIMLLSEPKKFSLSSA